MSGKVYDFNLLVSCSWGAYAKAREEVMQILSRLGDKMPLIKRTAARGIIGVRTKIDSREVIQRLRELFCEDPLTFRHTLKWVPVDLWTNAAIDSMKEAVTQLRDKVHAGERWRMTVEKRRYTRHHKIEIIRELADLIDEEVDLENPDKILRVEIIGKYAGISVLTPEDIFSVAKPYA
ncbi:MAG: THUMP domain-containing protein [Candidatus Bathyarchaeia archaeon]